MSLNGKNIIVTGGSRGIGKAIVKLLVSKGANVIFTYCKEEAMAKEVESYGSEYSVSVKAYKLDIMNYDEVSQFAGAVVKEYKKVDAIVNNAGIRRDKTLLYMEKRDWEDVINTNLTGVFNMTKSFMPYLLKERKGRIINISSVSGINGLSGQTNYSSSKAGIIGFTKALAKEVASFGLSINAVAPGPVETDMLDGLSDKVKSNLLLNVPIKRMCTPKEIAMMVHVLADDELTPEYLTGQVISIDGGMGL